MKSKSNSTFSCKAADVWSVGVVTYMLLTGGYNPFAGEETQDYLENVFKIELKTSNAITNNPLAQEFLKLIFTTEDKRKDIQTLLTHEFVSGECEPEKEFCTFLGCF